MNNLEKGIKITALSPLFIAIAEKIAQFTKIKDLSWHDGPLISHYKYNYDNHIYYWCDKNDNTHRWMLLRLLGMDIASIINKTKTLDTVIPSACLDEFVCFLDVDDTGFTCLTLVKLEDIPPEYKPGQVYLAE